LSLPSVKRNTRQEALYTQQRSSLPSVKNKTLSKGTLCQLFYFTECFLFGTWQRVSFPSVQKKTHLAKYLTLGKTGLCDGGKGKTLVRVKLQS
jgi:hypothetical protein